MKVDVSSIGTKFENFVQAGCRDLGSHRSRNMYCRKHIILPNLVLFLFSQIKKDCVKQTLFRPKINKFLPTFVLFLDKRESNLCNLSLSYANFCVIFSQSCDGENVNKSLVACQSLQQYQRSADFTQGQTLINYES